MGATAQEPDEIVQVGMGNTGAELVASGMTLVRLENDTQMTVAVQRPRNEAKILDGALQELDLYPSLAEKAMYSKPVGKDESGRMKYASGLSIRTAESLANRWGNNAYGCEIVGEDENSATLSAVYLDYETNTRTVLQKRVSKHYKPKKGTGLVKYSPDRFDVILAANQSKLLREAILRRLPAGLKQEYELKVKEMLSKKPIDERRSKLISTFSTLGVKKDQLETLMDKPVDKFDHEDMTELVGVFNAIKDGETTIEALIEKQTSSPTYDLAPDLLADLKDVLLTLGVTPADQSMQLATLKGNNDAAKTLHETLYKFITNITHSMGILEMSPAEQVSLLQDTKADITSLKAIEQTLDNRIIEKGKKANGSPDMAPDGEELFGKQNGTKGKKK